MLFVTFRTKENSLTSAAEVLETNLLTDLPVDTLDALDAGFEVVAGPTHTPEKYIPRPANGLGDAITVPERFTWHLIKRY